MLKANSDLLIRPTASEGSSTQSMLVTQEQSGFEYLTFRAQSMSHRRKLYR